MSDSILELDGSFGEGGGQILRSCLSLSILTGKPFHLKNVRARRPKPGLQAQHLRSVLAAATICNGQVNGASLGSCDLSFTPGEIRAGRYRFEIGTAGATGLVLHTIYLPLAIRGVATSEITLVGGTHVKASPSFHFLDGTWRRFLERLGIHVDLRLVRPGFYPRGGGVIEAIVQPCSSVRQAHFPARKEVSVHGFSAVAGLDPGIARRQARRVEQLLQREGFDVAIEEQTWEGGPGSVIVLTVETGSTPAVFVGLGERGKPADRVAAEVASEVRGYLKADDCLVDPHSADQLLLPLVFTDGESSFHTSEITLHLTTNVEVIRRFLPRQIDWEGELGQPGVVRVRAAEV